MGVKVLLDTENQHLHEVDQQKEAWAALESPGADLDPDNSPPVPAEDMAPQTITDCGDFTLDFQQFSFWAFPLILEASRGPQRISKWNATSDRRSFEILSNNPVMVALSPGETPQSFSLVDSRTVIVIVHVLAPSVFGGSWSSDSSCSSSSLP